MPRRRQRVVLPPPVPELHVDRNIYGEGEAPLWTGLALHVGDLGELTDDEVIWLLSADQHGLVTRQQLLAAAVPEDVIDHRVKTGMLVKRHRGVYSIRHGEPSERERQMASIRPPARSRW